MPNETARESITLYFHEGTSDKVYQAAIAPQDGGFIVSFQFGRRGSTLQSGTKTPRPVDYPAARKIYDRLVKSKLAKGYSPGQEGVPYQATAGEHRATGVVPQLLNDTDEEEAHRLIADPDWWAQEKFDGRRVLIRRRGQEVEGINRRGLVIGLPQSIGAHARIIGGGESWIMDGEAMGDGYVAFDLLEQGGYDLRPWPYGRRYLTLRCLLLSAPGSGAIWPAETATDTADKQAMYQRLRAQHREGIVFKRQSAAYTPGRPARGGDQLKLKFVATAACLVAAPHPSRRSVALELLEGGQRVRIGRVSIPPNACIPAAGEILEAKYLYCFPGGSLYQPVYLGRRDDLRPADCTMDQLKFKSDGDERAA